MTVAVRDPDTCHKALGGFIVAAQTRTRSKAEMFISPSINHNSSAWACLRSSCSVFLKIQDIMWRFRCVFACCDCHHLVARQVLREPRPSRESGPDDIGVAPFFHRADEHVSESVSCPSAADPSLAKKGDRSVCHVRSRAYGMHSQSHAPCSVERRAYPSKARYMFETDREHVR